MTHYGSTTWRLLKWADRLLAPGSDRLLDPYLLRWFRFAARRWRCEDCGTIHAVRLRPAMTAYHYEGVEDTIDDPNRRLGLCPSCHNRYADHWSDMWREYNSSRL